MIDADAVLRAEAQATPPARVINDAARRAKRTIWVLLLVGNDLLDA